MFRTLPSACLSAPLRRQRCSMRPFLVAIALSIPAIAGASSPAPVVVELFTSQSCSSCPPAEAYLGALARRADVLPLSFHVDYWNHLGWVDRFSSPAFTQRQRDYAATLRTSVYTPQIVVDGREDVVGSNQRDAESAIRRAKASQAKVGVGVTVSKGRVEVNVEPTAARTAPARLLLLTFDPQATDSIAAGENAGRTINSSNIVRSLRRVGEWQGQQAHLAETLRGDEIGQRVAVLVQDEQGRIIGAGLAQ